MLTTTQGRFNYVFKTTKIINEPNCDRQCCASLALVPMPNMQKKSWRRMVMCKYIRTTRDWSIAAFVCLSGALFFTSILLKSPFSLIAYATFGFSCLIAVAYFKIGSRAGPNYPWRRDYDPERPEYYLPVNPHNEVL